jgi:hypothetical protein
MDVTFIEDEKSSDSSSSSSHFTYKSIPVSPSILYEQREQFVDHCKYLHKSVTFSTIKSFCKKGSEASCPLGRKNKTLKYRHSPRASNQGETFMSM